MLRFDDIKHMYLATEVVDLRKGINGYAILVKEVLGKDPMMIVYIYLPIPIIIR